MPEIRYGKTAKDKKSGAANRRRSNQEQRHAWINQNCDAGLCGRMKEQFPEHTLGGKGNSSVPFKVINGHRKQA